MHADVALTLIFRNLKKSENYKVEGLSKNIKEIFSKTGQEMSDSIKIEYIIDPIINIFEDSEGINSIAINMGCNFYYTGAKIGDDFDLLLSHKRQLFLKIMPKVCFLMGFLYQAKPYCFGECVDSTYIAKCKSKEYYGGQMLQNYVGEQPDPSDSIIDLYHWLSILNNGYSELDTSIVYSLFPKEKITLPIIEKS